MVKSWPGHFNSSCKSITAAEGPQTRLYEYQTIKLPQAFSHQKVILIKRFDDNKKWGGLKNVFNPLDEMEETY